jgi:benzylsuccinate CoA-transferase BbsF subunit
LHFRARTGQGQYIDISQAETAAAMIGPAYLEYLVNGREAQPCGNFSPTAAPHGCYRCKGADQWCVIAIQSEDEWMRFCDIAGHREWLTDHRFSEPAARVAYRQELDYWIGEWTAKYTPHQVMMLLQREGIAAAAVQTAEDLYRDPHLRERGFAREVFHPQIGWVTRAGASVRMIEHGFTPGGEAHVAGQDNEAVLSQILGMSRAEILDLSERQVLR